MNSIKKIFAYGAFVVASFSSVLCKEEPRVAVGWIGNGVEGKSGVALYNPVTGSLLLKNDFEHMTNGQGNAPMYLSFLAPYSNGLLIGLNKNNLWVYNQDYEINRSKPATKSEMSAYLVVKNGDTYDIIAATQDGSIKAYDSETGTVVISFDFVDHSGVAGYQIGISCLAMYQQDGKPFLVAGSTAGFIDIYDYQTGVCVRSINVYDNNGFYQPSWVNNIVVFQDGDAIKIVASSCSTPTDISGQLGCWDATTGEKEYVVWYCNNGIVNPKEYTQGDIYSLQLYKDVDGKLKLMTSAQDPQGMIKIWDPLTGNVIQSLYDERFANTSTVCVRAFESKDETGKVIKFVAGYWSGEIAVWNTRTGLVEAYVNQNENVPEPSSKLVRFITLFDYQDTKYCTAGNDNGGVFTYRLNDLQLIMSWSLGEKNIVSCLANPQELLTDPAKYQFCFNLPLGCYVPRVDLDNLDIISTNQVVEH